MKDAAEHATHIVAASVDELMWHSTGSPRLWIPTVEHTQSGELRSRR